MLQWAVKKKKVIQMTIKRDNKPVIQEINISSK